MEVQVQVQVRITKIQKLQIHYTNLKLKLQVSEVLVLKRIHCLLIVRILRQMTRPEED